MHPLISASTAKERKLAEDAEAEREAEEVVKAAAEARK